MNCWPVWTVSCCARTRATWSTDPPGGNGETMRTGFEGHGAWAWRPAERSSPRTNAAIRFMTLLSCRSGWRGVLLLEGLPAAVACERRDRTTLRDLHRAVLELGDLPEGIERRIGELVGGGFVERERDEDRTARRALVGARHEADAAAPGGD